MRDPLEFLLAGMDNPPPDECEDWDIAPVRGALTPLAAPA